MRQVGDLNRRSQYDQAITLLKDHLASNPRSLLVNQNLGAMYGNKQHYPKAIEYYKKELELNPQAAGTFKKLGLAHLKLGQRREALACYKACQQLNPGDWESAHYVGEMHRLLGQEERAIQGFEQAIQLNSNNPGPWIGWGKMLLEQGELEAARDRFMQAVQLDLNDPDANYNLGMVLIRLGQEENGRQILARFRELARVQDKVDFLRNARNLTKSGPKVRLQLGEQFHKQQKYPEALQEFQTAVAMDPNLWTGHYLSGVVYREMKRYPEALAAFEKAAGIGQGTFEVYYSLAETRVILKQPKEALQALARAQAARALQQEEVRHISELFVRSGYIETGINLLKQLTDRNPSDHQSLFAIGITLHNAGESERALTYYQRARALKPSFPPYQVAWSMAKLDQGQSEGVRQALSQVPDRQLADYSHQFRNLPGASQLRTLLEDSVSNKQ